MKNWSLFSSDLLKYLAIFKVPFFHAGGHKLNILTTKMSTTMQQRVTTTAAPQEVPIRGYTMKELSVLYGVSTKCLRTWLEPHLEVVGKRKGRYFTTLQVRVIFDKLGLPG